MKAIKTLPEALYVYGLPRSGSNLFAAFMHGHEEIWSLNCGGGKLRSIRNWPEAKQRCIYANGGFKKNIQLVKYFLFDEMKPKSLLQTLIGKRYPSPKLNIVTVRNPLAIALSMNNFAKKYHQNLWDLSQQQQLRKFVLKFKAYLKKCSKLDAYWISLIEFFKDLDFQVSSLLKYLNLL